MYSFRELQKASKNTVEGKEKRIAVMGNCATQFFSQAISGYAKLSGLNVSVFDADYNQIDQLLIDSGSEVYKFSPEFVVLCLSTEKLYEEFLDSSITDRNSFAEKIISKISNYWNLITSYSQSRIIQPNFIEIDDKVLGNYSCKVESSFVYQIRQLNFLLQKAGRDNSSVYFIDILSIQIQMGVEKFFSPKLYYSSKIPISMDALPHVAKAVTDVLIAMEGKVKKCVILDLDNTLWGGVIGDDGMAGIEIGELGKGHVFTNLQRWLKQLREYGIILAVCSKNDEEIAKEPFEKHEEMVLRFSDISVFVANWEDKASNIKLIQESLNIGLDSMVFLDDNPFERNQVKERYPEIEVPDLPEDPSKWLGFLQNKNYFETVTYSAETSDRTKMYQAEYERKKLEHSFETIDDYLKGLEMIASAKSFEPARYPRIAELTQRSNQFNLRTIRYTEDEIKRIAEDSEHLTFYYTLKDKFGDHGLVSVVIMKKEKDDTAFIDTWLMSCRVLKRGMEEFVINKLVDIAKDSGIKIVEAEYLPTQKNKMVADIYDRMGFNNLGNGKYKLSLNEYKYNKTYIREEL